MSSKISPDSIAKICRFLSVNDMSKYSRVNKGIYEIYKKEQEEEKKKLKKLIKTHFPTGLLNVGINTKSIYRIQYEKKNPVNTLLMTCIDKDLQSVNHVNLLSYTKWIMRGHSYRIAYKYIGMGYRAELLYYYKNRTFDIVLAGGSNGWDAQYNEEKIKKLTKGKFQTIFQAFDIILDNNKLDKYLRK